LLRAPDAKYKWKIFRNRHPWQNAEVQLMKSKFLYTILFLVSISAFADGELKNFTPGIYSLKSGPAEQCGDGQFEVRDNGTNLGLGYLHGFDLTNAGKSMPGDAPGDDGCIYEVRNTMVVQEKKTLLTFIEMRKCGGVLKHTLTKSAELQDGQVKMDVKQTGKPTFHYSCGWTANAVHK
jgi:hypothetical protein